MVERQEPAIEYDRKRDAVELQGTRLLGYLRSRLANEQDAQDLAQEAYLRLLRVPDKTLVRDPVAYLFRIARNLLHELYTTLPPETTLVSDGDLIDDSPAPEELADTRQHVERLEEVLNHLPPKCRAVMVLHRRDGMTYDEIGVELGISSAMVKKYLAQGLARCQARLRRFRE